MIDIERISWLARIKLDEKEKEELSKDISKILELFKKIQQVEIVDENLKKENFIEKFFREEQTPEYFDKNLIIQNFPKKEEDLLEVPKIL